MLLIILGKNYHPQWMAPEALQKSPKTINVKAADMWSFAVLLWELSAREVPFAHLSPMEAGMKVCRYSSKFDNPYRNLLNLIRYQQHQMLFSISYF